MKKNRSLRSMIFFLAVVLIIPILCFTLYLQVQTWRTMKHNLQRELEGELNTANHTLEMVIDKYDMVLYDFCTNDEIIELVEQINESEKPSDAVKYQIRRSLEGKEYLFPAIPQCILDVNLENQTVTVHILDGLLDL